MMTVQELDLAIREMLNRDREFIGAYWRAAWGRPDLSTDAVIAILSSSPDEPKDDPE